MNDKRQVLLNLIRAPFPLCLALALTLLAATTAHAQARAPSPQISFPQPNADKSGGDLDDVGDTDPEYAARRLRAINEMRQRALVSDTNKLLKLASELDLEIHQADTGSSTPDQIRKLVAIEKLARSVKEKMSTPIQETPVYHRPTIPTMH